MVKRSDVLRRVEGEEADVPYEETRLARRAVGARRRLAGLLLVGASALVVEALVARGAGWALAALVVGLAAWGVHRGRLGAVVAAAFAALLAFALPLRLFFVADPDAATAFALVVSMALGVAALPDVVTLLRDAELQYAYGRWARREG